MILIADSGSTKCDWALVDSNGVIISIFNTMGFNPFFQTPEIIKKELGNNRGHFPPLKRIKKVFLYGAGCSSPTRKKVIEDGLKLFFTNSEIFVDHDLVGAAYATYSGEPAISCILGTGSNSCFFDGEKVREEVPSLSHVLGDEGSGSYFGKRLLRAYLYKRLPTDLRSEIDKEYSLEKEEILARVYNENNPNVYLASFMKFVSDHQKHPFFKPIIKQGLNDFVDIHVKCFKEYKDVPVHFVGSVAYHCQAILEEVLREHKIKLGRVEKKPIEGLVQYHMDQVLEIL